MSSDRRVISGIFVRRECWTLSLRGWMVAFLLFLVSVMWLVKGLYPFLAITERTTGGVMVVEGWIRSDTMKQAAGEYVPEKYHDVLVVAAVSDVGNRWDSGRFKPQYIAEALIRLGVPKDRVHVIYCEVVKKDRTFESALAVREWLHRRGQPVKAIDVVTMGPHARRSRLLFQKAFGQHVTVGVMAMNEREYDPIHWWRSSEGVREVLFEGVAYIYAKCFFSSPRNLAE